jgi:uncharacterized membrane protein
MEMTMRHLSTGQFGVFGILLLLMLATSGRATAAAEDDTTDAGRSGRDIYSIVNLAAPTSYNGFINAHGQAAFEYPGPDGRTQVAFFNGDHIVDISPPGNERTFVGGLNEQGEVIFNARFLDAQSPGGLRYQPLRWSAARGRVVLPSLNVSEYASLDAINKHGQIAGLSATSSDNSSVRGVRWTSVNRLSSLPGVTGFAQSAAYGINDLNTVVGSGSDVNGRLTTLVWNADGRPTNLGTFGARSAYGIRINSQGDVLGWRLVDAATWGFFLSSPGKPAVSINTAYPATLNEAGEVIGAVRGPTTSEFRAFRYSRARGFLSLHPAGMFTSEANALNDAGVSVGLVRSSMLDEGRAYRWSRTGVATDLNLRLQNSPTGLVLTEGLGIATNGDILAQSNAGLVFLRRGGGTDAPVLGPLQIPALRENELARLTLSFRDRNVRDTHTATIDWGDGSGRLPAVVRERNGSGTVLAEHTYGVAGDYRATVIVTDSARRRTTMSALVRVGFTDGAQLVGEGMLQSAVATGSGVYSPAARTAFRLAAPLALETAAGTPFVFRLLGSTSFNGETLDRITFDGNRVRLEGTGQLHNRPGYRFVIDAVAGEGDALASASRMAVRIEESDGVGAMRKVMFEAGRGAAMPQDLTQAGSQTASQAAQASPASLLYRGALRLTGQTSKTGQAGQP